MSTVAVAYSGFKEVELRYAFDDEAIFLLFLPLLSYDENGQRVGRLAMSWKPSPDYSEVTYHLRSDVRWHDGVPVTADDVKFTLELLAHPGVLEISPGAIESVSVLDEFTIMVRGQGWPTPGDDNALYWTVIFPKHLLEDLDPNKFLQWEFWRRPVGNGPYRFLRYLPETAMAFEANPDYYLGRPQIDRVLLKFVGGAGLTELLSGNVDVAYANSVQSARLAADPRFRMYYNYHQGAVAAIYWQHDHPILGDARIRRALTLAINREELLQALNLTETLPLSDGIYTGRQGRRGQLPGHLPYDPTQAERLLETAGWKDNDGDGVRDRDGQPFRFTALVTTSHGYYELIAVHVQNQLRRVGVGLEIQVGEAGVVWKSLVTGDFEAAFAPIRFSLFLQRSFRLGYYNLGYHNAEVVKLIDQLGATADPNEADNIYSQLSDIFLAELPVTFLFPAGGTCIVHRRVQGLSSPWRGVPVAHMEHLWLEDEG